MRRLIRGRALSWAIVGASGFVGSGIVAALKEIQTGEVRFIKAPRLLSSSISEARDALRVLQKEQHIRDVTDQLADALAGTDVVVNAAGVAAPDTTNDSSVIGANTLLPVVLAEAANRAGAGKFIHISSAAVQGNKELLDESPEVNPFSPYSRSKALGEQAVALWKKTGERSEKSQMQVVTIRATSVQGPTRQTTLTLKKIARSPLASVAKPGDQPSVVSSLDGLSHFVVRIGSYSQVIPELLIQPWEGASVQDVMGLAGNGRRPKMIPVPFARGGVKLLRTFGLAFPQMKGLARRLEVMWFGQNQVAGWAVEAGLIAPVNQPAETLRKVLEFNKAPTN